MFTAKQVAELVQAAYDSGRAEGVGKGAQVREFLADHLIYDLERIKEAAEELESATFEGVACAYFGNHWSENGTCKECAANEGGEKCATLMFEDVRHRIEALR